MKKVDFGSVDSVLSAVLGTMDNNNDIHSPSYVLRYDLMQYNNSQMVELKIDKLIQSQKESEEKINDIYEYVQTVKSLNTKATAKKKTIITTEEKSIQRKAKLLQPKRRF